MSLSVDIASRNRPRASGCRATFFEDCNATANVDMTVASDVNEFPKVDAHSTFELALAVDADVTSISTDYSWIQEQRLFETNMIWMITKHWPIAQEGLFNDFHRSPRRFLRLALQ